MWNKIKNLFKRLFGLVDTNHDGKVSTREAQVAALNVQDVVDAAKADIKTTTEAVSSDVKVRVARIKEEVQDITDTAKEAVDQVQDIVEATKGGARRGRKPKPKFTVVK